MVGDSQGPAAEFYARARVEAVRMIIESARLVVLRRWPKPLKKSSKPKRPTDVTIADV